VHVSILPVHQSTQVHACKLDERYIGLVISAATVLQLSKTWSTPTAPTSIALLGPP
jgi:hypothetical protein